MCDVLKGFWRWWMRISDYERRLGRSPIG